MKKLSSHEKKRPKAAIKASGVQVFCNFSEIQRSSDLKPHPKNPKVHPAKQLDRYEHVVTGNGWRRPIVVSSLSGCIIKGHGAWQMALRRGWDVPVEIQHYTTAREELRDMLADNKLTELAETDDAKLAAILSEIGADEIDLTGFDAGELERLLNETVIPDAEFPITAKLGENYDYVLIFTTNSTEFVFLQTLLNIRQERSYKKNAIGLGRAVPLQQALKALYENRHSLDVAIRDHDHAPADTKRPRVRSKKPAR